MTYEVDIQRVSEEQREKREVLVECKGGSEKLAGARSVTRFIHARDQQQH